METPPPSLVFCSLLKTSLGNPYMKMLELLRIFVADAPKKENNKKNSFTPSQSTLKYIVLKIVHCEPFSVSEKFQKCLNIDDSQPRFK